MEGHNQSFLGGKNLTWWDSFREEEMDLEEVGGDEINQNGTYKILQELLKYIVKK